MDATIPAVVDRKRRRAPLSQPVCVEPDDDHFTRAIAPHPSTIHLPLLRRIVFFFS